VKPIGPIVERILVLATGFPSFEAELGYAVARGTMTLTLADISVLARHKDLNEARQKVAEMRRSVTVWRHIRDQLAIRIADETRAQMSVKAPKNVILARAHDINASQTLHEWEVNEIVVQTVWENLPIAPRRSHAR
jgi:hypothetical protein